MSSEIVKRLANYMQLRREAGQPPYGFFLGAGASVPSAYPTAEQFVDRFLADVVALDVGSLSQQEKRTRFNEQWQLAGNSNITAFIKKALPPVVPSVGYVLLANLARAQYVSTIITTNVDTLLDQAFTTGQADPQGYQFLSYPQFRTRQITHAFNSPLPRIKVLKLHGDLPTGMFLFTDKELTAFPRELSRLLNGILQLDMVFCGYGFGDEDVRKCLKRPRDAPRPSVFCVGPAPPNSETQRILQDYATGLQLVTGESGDFDVFMKELMHELGLYDMALLSTFQSKFDQGSLEGIGALLGPVWTGDGDLLLGDTSRPSVIQVGQLYFGEAEIDIKGEFVSQRHDHDWFGVAPAVNYQLGPHLAYLRANGWAEIIAPPSGLLGRSGHAADVSTGFHLRIRTFKKQIEAQVLGDDGKVLCAVLRPHSEQDRWNGGLYLHTYFTQIRLSSISVRPL